MQLTYNNELSVYDYNKLRQAVGWTALNEEQAKAGIEFSTMVVSCYDEDKIVGCARVLWDHGYVAYIADVMVIPAYQRLGIGKNMVGQLISSLSFQLKPEHRINVVLIAAKEKEPFYEKLGFVKNPNEYSGAGMTLCLKRDT